MTILQQHLAANMKQLRKKCGFSQSQLAEKARTSTNYIAMIETGKKFPSAPMLEKIADALGISSPELFSQQCIPQAALDALKVEIITEIETLIAQKVSLLNG